MKARILVAVIFVPLLLIVMLLLPAVCFGVVVGAICAVVALELIDAAEPGSDWFVKVAAALIALVMPVCASFGVEMGGFLVFLLFVVIFAWAILGYGTEQEISFQRIMVCVFAGGLIPLLMTSLVSLRVMENGKFYVLLPFIIAFLSDAGGYFTGVSLGKHKLIPKVSPKKTVEGSVGGFVFAIFFLIVYGLALKYGFKMDYNFGLAIVYGILGSAVTQLGDLAFSLIKREYDVKDFGNILPGHGGILDRFDSMIFVAPLTAALVTYLPLF